MQLVSELEKENVWREIPPNNTTVLGGNDKLQLLLQSDSQISHVTAQLFRKFTEKKSATQQDCSTQSVRAGHGVISFF